MKFLRRGGATMNGEYESHLKKDENRLSKITRHQPRARFKPFIEVVYLAARSALLRDYAAKTTLAPMSALRSK